MNFRSWTNIKLRTINLGLSWNCLHFFPVAWVARLSRCLRCTHGLLPLAYPCLGLGFWAEPALGAQRSACVSCPCCLGAPGGSEWTLPAKTCLSWSVFVLLPLFVQNDLLSTYSMPDSGPRIGDTAEKKTHSFGDSKFSNFHSSWWWGSKIYLSSKWQFVFPAWFLMWMPRGKNRKIETDNGKNNSWTFWASFTIHKIMAMFKIHWFKMWTFSILCYSEWSYSMLYYFICKEK